MGAGLLTAPSRRTRLCGMPVPALHPCADTPSPCPTPSLQASNPLVMVQAYRLLAEEQYARGWDYPLHLGVTEAGEGEDGRMKSAIGIGALLMDGLGDTIRVSLTEDPEFEMDPCGRCVGPGWAQGVGLWG